MMEDILVVDDNFLTDMDHQRPGRGETLNSVVQHLSIIVGRTAVRHSLSQDFERLSEFVETLSDTICGLLFEVLNGIFKVIKDEVSITEALEHFRSFSLEEALKDALHNELSSLHIFDLRFVWSDTNGAGAWHLSDTSEISNDGTDIFTEVLI
jgi:hypothetical protein